MTKKKHSKKAKEAEEESAEVENEQQEKTSDEQPAEGSQEQAPTTPESSEEWEWSEAFSSEWWQDSTGESAATSGKKHGDHWRRIDESKYISHLTTSRKDNTHEAKKRFGHGAGDTWGDKAASDLIKVRGKDFRKEMAKKKRASWRGGGALETGINSIPFPDSDSDSD
ncbi:hypothetical protein FOZ63_008378 [Perkinsus olseni]|nr:hypothetical protein FOZ63_008378 [Perkinsus olseni]KAF4727344.1 hypothetical protein FOZ63_008378 [Perkinsus olseni]